MAYDASNDSSKVIELKNVSQQFIVGGEPLDVLKNISFSIQANSFTVIIGPSGSGKSTLLNILSGLHPPFSGELIIQGKNIYELTPNELAHFRANQVGFVRQTNDWIKSLNVIENLSIPLFTLGYSRRKAAKVAEIALEQVKMSEYAKKYPVLLSGGEQQRIAVARALVNNPLFIIADEPTGNLDTKSGDMIMGLLIKMQKELRRTVILVTHNLEFLSLADNLIKIQDGTVECIKSKDIKKMASEFITDLRGRITHLSEEKYHARSN